MLPCFLPPPPYSLDSYTQFSYTFCSLPIEELEREKEKEELVGGWRDESKREMWKATRFLATNLKTTEGIVEDETNRVLHLEEKSSGDSGDRKGTLDFRLKGKKISEEA